MVSSRHSWIDALRGIGALLVLAGHGADQFLYDGGEMIGLAWLIMHSGAHTGVVAFFLVSGYVSAQSIEYSPAGFWARRAVRIVPPLLVCWLLSSWWLGTPIGHFWTLIVEVICYLLAPWLAQRTWRWLVLGAPLTGIAWGVALRLAGQKHDRAAIC